MHCVVNVIGCDFYREICAKETRNNETHFNFFIMLINTVFLSVVRKYDRIIREIN